MVRRLIASAAVVLALAGAGAASAATLDDIRALGYTVYLQFDNGSCRAWTVVGFGVNTSLGCEGTPDFQVAVDSIANPLVHYERKWQFEHPEQLQAANALVAKCYSVNRTAPMADSWRVAGGVTDLTVAGAELPVLDTTLPNRRQADGTCPTGTGTSQTVPSGTGPGVKVPGETAADTTESTTSTAETSSSSGSKSAPTSTFQMTSSGLLWTDEATASRLVVPRGKVAVF